MFRGFFREAFGLLALACGLGASVFFGEGWGGELAQRWNWSPGFARVVAHVGLFVVPYTLLQGLGYALHRLGRAVLLGGMDRVAGALFGAATGVLLAGAGLWVMREWGWGGALLARSSLAAPLMDAFRRVARWASAGGL